MALTAPSVHVRDKETGLEYFVSEARFKSTPNLWDRLDSGKPKTSVADAAAKKATSGRQADPKKETA